jgi:hypothetical protein
MPQTLVAITALSTPVKHSDFTTKHLDQCLSALDDLACLQLKALMATFLAYELNSYGGTDYSTPPNFKQLHQDAYALFGGYTIEDEVDNIQKLKVECALAWNAAVAKGATLSTDVNTLLALMPGSLACSNQHLNIMILVLKYKLAVLGA